MLIFRIHCHYYVHLFKMLYCINVCSRVFFFIAEICLLAGSVRNAYHTKYRNYYPNRPLSCEFLRKGVFGAGAAFIFLTCIVSELYYISHSKANDGQASYARDTGVRMGNL